MTVSKNQAGGRRKLKTALKKATGTKGKSKNEEFYCLTCRVKRTVRSIKDITFRKSKNGHNQIISHCNAKGCTSKLYKFISNEDAEKFKKLKTTIG